MREMTGSDESWAKYNHLLVLEQAIAARAWPTLIEPLRSRDYFQSKMTSKHEKEAWQSFVEEPLGNVIEKYAEHDALRGLLMTDGKIGVHTEPHDPSLLQNRCFLYHVIGGGDGEWRVPVGGMRSLVDSLFDSCRKAGVTVQPSSEVSHLELGKGKHSVTFQYEGKAHQVDAGHVLFNAGPRTFARILGQSWQPKETDEGSVIKINMLLNRLPKVKAKAVSSQEAFAGSFHIDEGYTQMQQSYKESSHGQFQASHLAKCIATPSPTPPSFRKS